MKVIRFHPDHPVERARACSEQLQRDGWSLSTHLDDPFRVIILLDGPWSRLDEQLAHFEKGDRNIELISDLPDFPLASRQLKPEHTAIHVGDFSLSPEHFGVIAGPCAIESEQQAHQIAAAIASCGIRMMRGGAFKPRTSPYSFQGLGVEGLRIIHEAARSQGLAVITELMDISLLEAVSQYSDVIQVGARNMSNFHMLKALGQQDKPVLLKRGMSATVKEWLLASEYILDGGNSNIILCERGIRSFDNTLRNTFDLGGLKAAQSMTHLPVIADPSHGAGDRRFVPDLAVAAYAAGADGLMFEVHPEPEQALSDGEQSLDFLGMRQLLQRLLSLATVMDRRVDLSMHSSQKSHSCVE